MSYVDRLFAKTAKQKARRKSRGEAAKRGVELITLFPQSPTIRLGSTQDDWRKVGADIRTAMKRFELHD